jgi:hypothetical protein
MLSLDGYFGARILASIQVSEMPAECRLSNVFLPALGRIIRNKACPRMKTSLRRHVLPPRLVRNIMKRSDKYFSHPRAFGDTTFGETRANVAASDHFLRQFIPNNEKTERRMQHGRTERETNMERANATLAA